MDGGPRVNADLVGKEGRVVARVKEALNETVRASGGESECVWGDG